MAIQEYRNVIERRELAGVVVFAIVGIVLVALIAGNGCMIGDGERITILAVAQRLLQERGLPAKHPQR